jgi:hypothetical protein
MSQKLPTICDNDLIWLKLSGPLSQLNQVNKKDLEDALFKGMSIRLDLLPLEEAIVTPAPHTLDPTVQYDGYIEQLPDTAEHKAYLKQLWRSL